mmetsp:Transcript_35933/g.50910  ORF Transcript_35933/g.50910 Transcript_35933/m.50910 type:complete len:214 (-) Transcript_35933:1862-2503(-)
MIPISVGILSILLFDPCSSLNSVSRTISVGIEPSIMLFVKVKLDDKSVRRPRVLGSDPVKILFSRRNSLSSCVNKPISLGIDPVSLLSFKRSDDFNAVSPPISVGIVPVSCMASSFRFCRLVNWPMLVGMVPDIWLPEIAKVFKFSAGRFSKSAFNGPVMLLCPTLNFFMDDFAGNAGKFPSIWLFEISNISSCGCNVMILYGMEPVNLLPPM